MSNSAGAGQRLGALAALGAFSFWGVAPIYFKFLHDVPPLEVISHRIIWAIPLLVGFLCWRDGPREFWRRMHLPPRLIVGLTLSGLLVAFNWLVFVYAVVNDQVLATSLGYFINPLVNTVLGMVFLAERLNSLRAVAVLLAAVGTIYLGFFLGEAPWLALSLAFSFGFYGLLRKQYGVGPMIGLLWETLLLAPAALAYLIWAVDQQQLVFMHQRGSLDVLLLVAGLVTILPLIGFNVAAQHLSLTVLGFFQYLAPSISFMLAVIFFQEPFTRGHQVAFTCIWCALFLVSVVPLIRQRIRQRRVGAGSAS